MENITPEIISQDNFIIIEDTNADDHTEEVVLDENTIILAAGDVYSEMNMSVLLSALKKSGLSYEDIADAKNISISSIYKFFSKKSKSPSLYNALMIFKAIGVSMDEVFGLKKTVPSECQKRLDQLEQSMSDLQKIIAEQNKLIKQQTALIKTTKNIETDEFDN